MPNLLDNAGVRLAASISIGLIVLTIIANIMVLDSDFAVYPVEVRPALEWLVDGLYRLDFILPVQLILYLFFISVAVEVIFLSVKIVIFLHGLFTKKI